MVRPYSMDLRERLVAAVDAGNAVVVSQTSHTHDVVLARVALKPGACRLTASDATPHSLDAAIVVVETDPPADTSFDSFADAEVRTAARAATLAHGLERDKVYELIESYGTD